MPPQPIPTRQLLTEFDRLHREALGVPAVIRPGKDAALISTLWRSHGSMVTDLMQDFFSSDDPFILDSGYTVGVFISQAGKLIARRVRGRALAPKGPPSKVARSFDAVDAAFDAIERHYADQGQPGPTTDRLKAPDRGDWQGTARPGGLRRVR